MRYWGHVRKTARGSYYVVIPAAHARDLMKEHGLLDLDGHEVRVEVAL